MEPQESPTFVKSKQLYDILGNTIICFFGREWDENIDTTLVSVC